MADPNKHPNHLGVWGWLGGGRWGVERYLYSLHRLTGLGLLLYLLLHIFVTSARAFGKQSWEAWMQAVSAPVFAWGEFLVFIAFGFHALNGVRLILVELGYAVGKPEDPVYPYRSSLNSQRPLTVILMIVATLVIAAGAYDFLALSH
jgi:succinate dehydrogenase / fumarate reductase cytochrome b subunit